LSDSKETRYATTLFRDALLELVPKFSGNMEVDAFLKHYLELTEEEPDQPLHAPSPYFVTCFCAQDDDLGQWRGYCDGENGYAIGFEAQGLFGIPGSIVVRVNYDKDLHQEIAGRVAAATVSFFQDGLAKKRAESTEAWQNEFVPRWEESISRLAPLVKDPAFIAEHEFRIVHEFSFLEMRNLEFIQKSTMMSRHIRLTLPNGGKMWIPRLPVKRIMVGPGRHREITRVSVDLLLKKMGYMGIPVVSSKIPFQKT
jgi:hypothetical protein